MRIDARYAHARRQTPGKQFFKIGKIEPETVHARIRFDMAGNAHTILFARRRNERIIGRVGNGERQAVPRRAQNICPAQRRAENEHFLRNARMAQLRALFRERDGEPVGYTR